jgi:hypothetical protein
VSRCLYVSFFTPDYIEPASKLVQSLYEHGLDYEVPKVPDTGRWILNCARKPKFIQDMLHHYPGRPLVWTDADSVVRQRPKMFEEQEYGADALICEYTWQRGNRVETLSGTMFFAPTPGAARLVDIWVGLQAAYAETMDQRVLARAIELAREEGIRIGRLPVEYCFITDLHRLEWPAANAVFEHFQYSRVRKQKDREVKR